MKNETKREKDESREIKMETKEYFMRSIIIKGTRVKLTRRGRTLTSKIALYINGQMSGEFNTSKLAMGYANSFISKTTKGN